MRDIQVSRIPYVWRHCELRSGMFGMGFMGSGGSLSSKISDYTISIPGAVGEPGAFNDTTGVSGTFITATTDLPDLGSGFQWGIEAISSDARIGVVSTASGQGNTMGITTSAAIYSGDSAAFTVTVTNGVLMLGFPFIANGTVSSQWYESDAIFAWSTITDTAPAAVNPTLGNAVAKTVGADAVVSGDLWDMGGVTRYLNASGLASNPPANVPILFACVLDKDNHTAGFQKIAQFGSARGLTFYTGAGIPSGFTARFNNAANFDVKFVGTMPAGKHVFWGFWDGTTARAGYDQIENSAAALAMATFNGLNASVNIGDAVSNMKHGSVQVIARTGLTLAAAKAIVAKMQLHHSIA